MKFQQFALDDRVQLHSLGTNSSLNGRKGTIHGTSSQYGNSYIYIVHLDEIYHMNRSVTIPCVCLKLEGT